MGRDFWNLETAAMEIGRAFGVGICFQQASVPFIAHCHIIIINVFVYFQTQPNSIAIAINHAT
jgi:hypothetical protein